MNHKQKASELLGEKKEVLWDCNCRGLGCKHCYSQGSNQMHSKTVGVVVGLLEKNERLLALLKDILEWDGILPHSKERIKQVIAKAEVTNDK